MQDTDGNHWDAIVIGSGMGGIHRPQHCRKRATRYCFWSSTKPWGGLTHSFTREGFSWDVGIHTIPRLICSRGDRERGMIDWLTHTPMKFEPMGAVYDNLHLGDAPPLALSRPFEAQERDLKYRFPDEAEAIEEWIAALRKGRRTMYAIASTLPCPTLSVYD